MPDNSSVAIAADDALVRQVLRRACEDHGITVVGEAANQRELHQLCTSHDPAPGVVVTTECLDGVFIEESVAAALANFPVIALSADPSTARAVALLGGRLSGYLTYDSGLEDVANGVVAVAAGNVAIDPAVVSTIVEQWRRLRGQPVAIASRRRSSLTARELDVLAAMTEGLSGKAIAARLGVALKTVENHKIRVFDKLGVRSQAHAVTVAYSMGLSPEAPDRVAE